MSKRRDRVVAKARMLRLMCNELCDNIEAREANESSLGTYGSVGYGLENGQAKTQIQNDIRRCRRTLLDLHKLIGEEI